MGRQSGSRSGGRAAPSRSSSTSTRSRTETKTQTKPQSAPPPAPVHNSPPTQQPTSQAPAMGGGGGGGGMMSGLGSMIMQGMAFGGGSAIAHRAVDAVAGPRSVQVEHKNSNDNQPQQQMAPASSQDNNSDDMGCRDERSQFNQCLTSNRNDPSQCQFYFDVFSQCQRNAKESKQKWQ